MQYNVPDGGSMFQFATPTRNGDSVRSVERVFDLLAILEKVDHPMGVSELGRAAGMPKTTAQRLLAVLESRGFVEKQQGRYQVGVASVPLAHAFFLRNNLTRAALPVLQELAAGFSGDGHPIREGGLRPGGRTTCRGSAPSSIHDAHWAASTPARRRREGAGGGHAGGRTSPVAGSSRRDSIGQWGFLEQDRHSGGVGEHSTSGFLNLP